MRRTAVRDVAELLDSPEVTALIAAVEAVGDKRGRKGFGTRALVGACLVKGLFNLPTWTWVAAVSTRKGGGFYGFKIHAAVCTVTGLPMAWQIKPARRQESNFVAPPLDTIRARGFHPTTVAMDKGYDNSRVYAECEERGCEPIIPLRALASRR